MQRSEVTRGLSPAPSSTTGKPQPAHCTPTEHSSCPPEHRQHVDRKSQAIETLWSVIQELVPCWRRSIRGQRGHGAGCAGDTMRPWSGTKTSFLLHIFPFECALAPVTALLFPCFLDLYHILYFPSHQARRNLPYQGWAMQPGQLSPLRTASDPAHTVPRTSTSLLTWKREIKVFLAKPYNMMDDWWLTTALSPWRSHRHCLSWQLAGIFSF